MGIGYGEHYEDQQAIKRPALRLMQTCSTHEALTCRRCQEPSQLLTLETGFLRPPRLTRTR